MRSQKLINETLDLVAMFWQENSDLKFFQMVDLLRYEVLKKSNSCPSFKLESEKTINILKEILK